MFVVLHRNPVLVNTLKNERPLYTLQPHYTIASLLKYSRLHICLPFGLGLNLSLSYILRVTYILDLIAIKIVCEKQKL